MTSGARRPPPPAPIRQVGDPVLRTPTAPVTAFDADLVALVERMRASMHAAEGVGLAANQIGIGRSVFVYEIGPSSGVVVNPVLVETAGEVVEDEEGCLSVAGQVFFTPRFERATVRGLDLDGTPVEIVGEGLLARCLQHETDHLAGRLYLDHLSGAERRAALRAAAEREAQHSTGGTFGAF